MHINACTIYLRQGDRVSTAGASATGTRSSCAMSSSCAPTPTTRSRSPSPARSRCRTRPKNEFYKDEEELVMDYAVAVNAELRDLKAAGADVIQLDEPWLQARSEEARRLALPAIDRALDGILGQRHCTFALATPMSPATSRMFTRSCPSSPPRRSSRSRSKRPNPISISRPSMASPTRP